MQAPTLWLAASLFLAGCGNEEPKVPSAPRPAPPVVAARAAPRSPQVTTCRANPSTVYGDEPVVFVLEGPDALTPATVEALDATGASRARGDVAVPGSWQALNLGSGDFSLHVEGSSVTCRVTVNRELSRASSNAR